MILSPRAPTRTTFDRSSPVLAYWLVRCEGFRLECRDGSRGVVEQVVLDPLHHTARALVVRDRRRFGTSVLVPADDVEAVSPFQEVLLGSRLRAGEQRGTAVTGPARRVLAASLRGSWRAWTSGAAHARRALVIALPVLASAAIIGARVARYGLGAAAASARARASRAGPVVVAVGMRGDLMLRRALAWAAATGTAAVHRGRRLVRAEPLDG